MAPAPGPALNVEPAIALAFAAVLAGYPFLAVADRDTRFRLLRSRALPFAAAEIAIGGLSLGLAVLAVPPGVLGLALNIGVLLGGLAALRWAPPPSKEQAET